MKDKRLLHPCPMTAVGKCVAEVQDKAAGHEYSTGGCCLAKRCWVAEEKACLGLKIKPKGGWGGVPTSTHLLSGRCCSRHSSHPSCLRPKSLASLVAVTLKLAGERHFTHFLA